MKSLFVLVLAFAASNASAKILITYFAGKSEQTSTMYEDQEVTGIYPSIAGHGGVEFLSDTGTICIVTGKTMAAEGWTLDSLDESVQSEDVLKFICKFPGKFGYSGIILP